MQLAPYLFFEGNCEEALKFYARVLGGEIEGLMRIGESPMAHSSPPEHQNRIMHSTFNGPGITFMAADSPEPEGETRRVSLSLASSDAAEGARVFEALAQGGTVTMPYTKQFWGATFGMLYDRFGIRWMVNAG